MLVYRIASEAYIHDLSGYGAKRYGGRWNREGVAVLYTGSSIALCAWEYWVHLPEQVTLNQNAFSVAAIDVPDTSIKLLVDGELPTDWVTQSDGLFTLTDEWIRRQEYLAMRVPSAVIPNEFNFLVNPTHPQFEQVVLRSVSAFSFDKRAFGRLLR